MERINGKHLLVLAALILSVNFIMMAEFFQREQEIILSAQAAEVSPGEMKQTTRIIGKPPEEEPRSDNTKSMESVKTVKVTQEYLDQIFQQKEERIAYLTFDDGPSPNNTPKIVEILEAEEIKATFFVLGKQAELYPDLVKEIHNRGHVIGNHGYSHQYKQIYSSIDSYMADIKRSEAILKEILGEDYDLRLTRFPGGSFGKKKAPFRRAIIEADYVHIDWNVLNGDGEVVTPTVDYVMGRFNATLKKQGAMVILMHDSAPKKATVEALPEIIQQLKESGYRFETLPRTMESPQEVSNIDDRLLF